MFAGIKDFLFLDFETYYAKNYSLGTLTIPEYILDPRYEDIVCAVAFNSQPSFAVDGPDFGKFIATVNPETTATVTFNALFDNAILAWRYGWVPKLMLDSMNMARALRGHILPRLNLKLVCKILNTPHQKGDALCKVIGMRRADIIAKGLWPEFCQYANDDNEGSRDIFTQLLPEFPKSEMRIMDMVTRAAVQPKFHLDKTGLVAHLAQVRADKIALLEAAAQAAGDHSMTTTVNAMIDLKAAIKAVGLMSSNKFAERLLDLGVAVEYKPGKVAGSRVPAFAKTDQFMVELLEHPDPLIQALAAARVGVKSTLEESRTEKLIRIAELPWHNWPDGTPRQYSGGEMPMPMVYSGAHTHRLSGAWRLNMQNLPRGSKAKPPKLRKSLIAGPGETVVVGDLAQIEARLVAWLAKCKPLLAEFAKPKGDPYSAFASIIFGQPVNRNYVDPATGDKPWAAHGFIGKTGVLGLGYQCGASKFYLMVKQLARSQGVDLKSIVKWTLDLAAKTVYDYRSSYAEIPQLWGMMKYAVEHIWSNPNSRPMRLGPVVISYGKIEGPNGLSMQYKNPRRNAKGDYVYTYGYGTYKMYAGKMLENIVQFLARIIIMNAALRLQTKGYNFQLQSHDELGYVVPLDDAATVKSLLYQELTRRPSWGMDIPLDAAVQSGPTYGDAK